MPTSFAKITNSVFKFLIVFCLSFVWINYYYKKFLLSIVFSILLSILVCLIFNILDFKLQTKKRLKLNNSKILNFTITQLKFYEFSESLEFISSALTMLNFSPTITKVGVVVNNCLIVPNFLKPLDEEKFVAIYNAFKLTSNKKLVIFSVAQTDAFEQFFKTINCPDVKILCGEQLYLNIIAPSGIEIKQKVKLAEPKKLHLLEIKNIIFNKTRAKGYFVSGLILLIGSLFYYYGLYYQIAASVLFVLSLFCFCNKKYNNYQNDLFE